MNTELTEQELSDIESEKHWRNIAKQDVILDRLKLAEAEAMSQEESRGGFFEVKHNIPFCDEKRMELRDAVQRAYVRELMTHGYTEREAWDETSRIYN